MRGKFPFLIPHSWKFADFAVFRLIWSDTVEVNIAGAYLLEKFFSRSDRAKLFRSWAGAVSLLHSSFVYWALFWLSIPPNDRPRWCWKEVTTSGELNTRLLTIHRMLNWPVDDSSEPSLHSFLTRRWAEDVSHDSYFRPEKFENTSEVNSETMNPNLTLNDATSFILEKVPPSYQQMLASNFSVRSSSLHLHLMVWMLTNLSVDSSDSRKMKNSWGRMDTTLMQNGRTLSRCNYRKHPIWQSLVVSTIDFTRRVEAELILVLKSVYGYGKETERAYFYQEGKHLSFR